MKSQQDMIELLKQSNFHHYKKSGVYNYEICDEEQEVVTDHKGNVETRNTAFPGDYILTDTQGGKYVVKPETFKKRYEVIDNTKAKAIGECWATEWCGGPIKFASPWKAGETISIDDDDYLASPNDQFTEAYAIIKDEFEASYALVKDNSSVATSSL